MSRRPPKDPILAFAYHLAFEAGQREFLREHPELKELFRDDFKEARRREELSAAIGRRRDERRRRDRK
jgi:hypothetical protein